MGLREWFSQLTIPPKPVQQASPAPRYTRPPVWTSPQKPEVSEPAARKSKTQGEWIPAGQLIQVQGLNIPGGLIYVGEHLRSVGASSGWDRGNDPALINPSLPVDFKHATRIAEFGYWPSYSEIGPAGRAFYLRWLAEGRRTPDTSIALVFLFFYGLERRCLSGELVEASELKVISAEVRSLIEIYGEQGSFLSYATSFLNVLELMQHVSLGTVGEPPLAFRTWELPATLRFALATFSAQGKQIPTDWALAWLYCAPESRLRTPSQRCADEFKKLWALRYVEKFKGGLIIKPNQTRLKISYHAASSGFSGSKQIDIPDLPDVTALKGPINKLVDLASACEDELDAFSRYLGKNPAKRNSLEAIALLPQELAASSDSSELLQLLRWVADQLATQPIATIQASEIATRWSAGATKLTKAESLSVAQLLAKHGFGIEPDVRFGGKPIAGGSIVLFKLPEKSPITATGAYTASAVLLHLATAVAIADGDFSEEEQSHFASHLESGMELSDGESVRLQAYVKSLEANGAPLTGLGKRLEHLSEPDRRELGAILVAVAAADGSVRPTEVTTLTKIYTLLKLEDGAVFTDIHAHTGHTGPALKPVTVRKGSSRRDFTIPQQPPELVDGRPQAVNLDMSIIESTLQESARVSALLGDIFNEDEPIIQPPTPVNSEATIGTLDAAHSEFIRELSAKSDWTRLEIEELAAKQRILPDGALDTVNDFAFEVCGDPLWSGEDTIEIDDQVLKELLA